MLKIESEIPKDSVELGSRDKSPSGKGSIEMPKVRLRLTRSQSQDDIVSQACDLLGQQIALNDLRLADVAMRSGMTRTRIKVLLDRRSNPKIRDLAAIAHALGGKLALQLIQSEVGVV